MRNKIISVLLVSVLLLAGCNFSKPVGATTDEGDNEINKISLDNEVIQSEVEEEAEPEPYEFNPHVHTDLMSEVVTEEMWGAFYNLCDALRAGEDTFECPSEEAYEWCTDSGTMGVFLPASCEMAEGDGYADGVGRIKYLTEKEAFLEREKNFEEEIVRMVNAAVKSNYSDFEKVMGMYAYVCKYWQYDYSDIDGCSIDEFGTYACLMTKKGICCEVAYAYSYLLLQVGVEAMPFGASCNHDWTYVQIDGIGYHVDATWGLHGDNPDGPLTLQYFMMTEKDRLNDGFEKESLEASIIWPIKRDYDLARFSANDARFKPLETMRLLEKWILKEMS